MEGISTAVGMTDAKASHAKRDMSFRRKPPALCALGIRRRPGQIPRSLIGRVQKWARLHVEGHAAWAGGESAFNGLFLGGAGSCGG